MSFIAYIVETMQTNNSHHFYYGENQQQVAPQGSRQYASAVELALKVHWMARELLVFSPCCKAEKAVL